MTMAKGRRPEIAGNGRAVRSSGVKKTTIPITASNIKELAILIPKEERNAKG